MEEKKQYKLIVIGGGAAGYFFAANLNSELGKNTLLLEKNTKTLAKVKVSGGGRCNVTHYCFDVKKLSSFYPRGEKFVQKIFSIFQPQDTITWFQQRGVKLKREEDNRVFPESNSSQTVVDLLRSEVQKNQVRVQMGCGVVDLQHGEQGWEVTTSLGTYFAEAIFFATGSNEACWEILKRLNIAIVPPVPSLFTFKIEDARIKDLQGLAFKEVELRIAGTKFKENGPLLITHWGLSAPAVLKTSARAARFLHEKKYETSVLINFVPSKNFDQVRSELQDFSIEHSKKKTITLPPFNLPKRYWQRLCELMEISDKNWADTGKKIINKLTEELTAASFQMQGKTTFKEEFVTAGGVELSEVDSTTMASVKYPSLYFAGEVLDIDALTGGFNFQAAWSTAWIAAREINESLIMNSE